MISMFRKVAGLGPIDRLRMRLNPHLITTTDGVRDRRELREVKGEVDNDNEHTEWVEYYDGTRLVHRSAHVRLKRMPQFVESFAGDLK